MEPGDLRYPKNWNEKLFQMLNDDVIRVKSTLRALAEAQSDLKENQRKLGQSIQYYEMSIPNIRQKKAAFAATLATFDNIRIDMEEQFRSIGEDVPPHLLADLEKKRKDLKQMSKPVVGSRIGFVLKNTDFSEERRTASHLCV